MIKGSMLIFFKHENTICRYCSNSSNSIVFLGLNIFKGLYFADVKGSSVFTINSNRNEFTLCIAVSDNVSIIIVELDI